MSVEAEPDRMAETLAVYPANGDLRSGAKLTFTAATPGEALARVMALAHERDALTDVQISFTPEVDTAGVPWATTVSLTLDARWAQTVRDLLDHLVDSGAIESWRVDQRNPNDRRLHIYGAKP